MQFDNDNGVIRIDTTGYYRLDAALYNADRAKWIGCFIKRKTDEKESKRRRLVGG